MEGFNLKIMTLDELPIDVEADIVDMDNALKENGRLYEFGFSPRATITAKFCGPFGDPTAYMIMGALIALRKNEAELIRVCPHEEA